MALPAGFDTITITNDYVSYRGDPCTGTVTFTPPSTAWLKHLGSDIIIVPASFQATLNSSGSFTITLPVTDDPDVVPTFTYQVAESITGPVVGTRNYAVEIPIAMLPGPVKLSDLAPVGVTETGTTALTRPVADTLYQPLGTAGEDVEPATATTLGIIQLAGDLGGVATSPTVPALLGKRAVASGNSQVYTRNASGTESSLTYATAATGSTIAQRTSTGTLVGATAVGATDLVPKSQMDATLSGHTHDVSTILDTGGPFGTSLMPAGYMVYVFGTVPGTRPARADQHVNYVTVADPAAVSQNNDLWTRM